MKNQNVYALLVGVGNYCSVGLVDLPTYYADLQMMKSGIVEGLCVPCENVRIVDGYEDDGFVTAKAMMKALVEFKSLLKGDDVLIYYFTGHGTNGNICFSNEAVCQQELIDYIAAISVKCKIAIFDCCESGGFSSSARSDMKVTDSLSEIVGRGLVVLASSSPNEVSRLGPGGNHSLFTGALSAAMSSLTTIREGCRDLRDICDYTRQIIVAWNNRNSCKQQYPVLKCSLVGNIYFKIADIKKYQGSSIQYKNDQYAVVAVNPLHTVAEKRYSVFVVTGDIESAEVLSSYSLEIVRNIRFEDVFSNEKSEFRLRGEPASAVWCYFGCDEKDIDNHNFYAHSIWANDTTREKYYKSYHHTEENNGIMVCWNQSYQMIRKMMQEPESSEEYILKNKELLVAVVNLAETFSADLENLFNKQMAIEDLISKYNLWISQIRQKHMVLSDLPVPPKELRAWADEIMSLSGELLDISVVLDCARERSSLTDRDIWLMKNSLKKYYQSLDRLKQFDRLC